MYEKQMYRDERSLPTPHPTGGISGGMTPQTASQVAEKPRVAGQLDHLAKVLSECHHLSHSLEAAADRLGGPVPENAKDGAAMPTPTTIEQKMQMAIEYAEQLVARLARTSQRINASV